MHNLGTVINFEIMRALKKKSFWLVALGFPVLIAGVFAIVYFSNQTTDQAAKDLAKQNFSMQVTDESHLVSPAILKALKVQSASSKSAGIEAVESGKIDAYIYYPRDLTKQKIEVYGQDVGIFNNGRYDAMAKMLLSESVKATVSASVQTVIGGSVQSSVTTYRDNKVYDPAKEMIYPGVYLVLFYLLIAFFSGQILTSTTEEKENRVVEMLLTTIKARTLIIGKIIAIIGLALVQAVLIVLPILVIYLLFHDKLQLPSVDLASLPVNVPRILIGAAIFALSFLFFTGFMVLIGSSVPTAKDAGQFIGIIMILIFGPLYAVSLFISNPESTLVQALTLIPFTAPIPMLLRNAVGNLTTWETILGLSILAISSVIVMALAIRVFRFGVLEYSRKLSIKEIISRK